jgi:hypothetical protein
MLDQLRRLRDETVPQPELDGARSFLAGSFPLRLETADQVAGQLAGTLLLGLPLEDVTRYPERVRAVTGADVQRTAREHVHPDRAAVVVVGDGTQLLERLEAIAPVELFDVDGSPLARQEVLGGGGSPPWNGERLEPGERTYEVVANGSPAGSATYRLERDAEDWVSTVTVAASGTTQRTRLRFSALDFGPREVSQVIAQGPVQIDVEVTVTNGRLVGRVELPAALGGARDYDEELAPGTLLAGMDEYALAAADLSDGASFALPYFDLTQGETVPLRARVTGSEAVTVPAGSFDTWRVEVTGGSAPVILFLRQEAPHILVRQELAGPEVRLDLVTLTR